jgi:hypothetical protein
MWDEERNSHLFTGSSLARAQILLDEIQRQQLRMILPKDIPTLRAYGTGNYTRPDNVFCSNELADHMIYCNTEPARKPVNTDHMPVITVFDLEVLRIMMAPRPNYAATDWKKFREKLMPRINSRRATKTIKSTEEFDEVLTHLKNALQDTINEVVPIAKPCPHSKRWWNEDLTKLRRQLNRREKEAYRWRGYQWHPVHGEVKELQRKYAAAIQKTKTDHWQQWLAGTSEHTMWQVNKMIKNSTTDGGRA